MWISFRGDAQQVTAAFATPIDQYSVGGEVHYANTADPAIPADFAPVIAGIRGLHNFRLKPRYHRVNNPQMTSSNGSHHIVPDDFAVIYNVAPLYTAQVDGTGQKLVVVGQSDIAVSDITSFRSKFNLPDDRPAAHSGAGEHEPGGGVGRSGRVGSRYRVVERGGPQRFDTFRLFR